MLSLFFHVMRRDLLLAYRRPADVMTTLFFFMLVAALFPFGVGAETDLLRKMAPGVVWVAALLASMLALNRLFAQDYTDGTLEQMLLSSEPLVVLIMGKILAHWFIAGLPLLVAAPLLALQFDLPPQSISILMQSLALGTPILSMIGAIGAALTLGVRGGGVLLSLLILPLYIPVLIFGAGAVDADLSGTGAAANLLLLGGLLAASCALTPWVTGAALRIAVE